MRATCRAFLLLLRRRSPCVAQCEARAHALALDHTRKLPSIIGGSDYPNQTSQLVSLTIQITATNCPAGCQAYIAHNIAVLARQVDRVKLMMRVANGLSTALTLMVGVHALQHSVQLRFIYPHTSCAGLVGSMAPKCLPFRRTGRPIREGEPMLNHRLGRLTTQRPQ
jgi:hypothetical protein